MNNVYPVSSSNPSRIIPASPGGRHVIRNLSTGTIYLDSNTAVTPSSFPLLAGEGCIWQDDKGCVALAAPGNGGAQVGISDSLESPLGLGAVQAVLPVGTSVAINNTVTVGITGSANTVSVGNTPTVGITGTPSVTVSGTPNVAVTNTPTVGISGTSNSVQVSNSPTVGISGTPNVAVTNTPTVGISGSLNSVQVANTPNVGITGTPSVGIASGLADAVQTAAWSAAGGVLIGAMAGYSGASFQLSAGTLANIITPYVSMDNGVTFQNTVFYDVTSNTTSPTITVTNPNPNVGKVIVVPAGATHVAVSCPAGAGAANVRLTRTTGAVLPAILNTPGVTGAKTSQTVLSGATQNAVSVATNSSNIALTTTVIPGGSQSIELHNCLFTTTGAGGTGPNTGKLIRSDTGANLAIPQSVVVAGGVASQAKDFQGVLLPPGVAVQSVTATPGFGQSSTVSVDINYNLVG